MDSITQATLGAAIGEAALGKKIGGKGALLGAIIATVPDLDVALYLFYDSFEMLSIHRGFSHSVLFSFLGAGLIAFLLKKMRWTAKVEISKLFFFAWLALITHMLLDAFTAYGTQLFLPFSDARIGFDSINVVDPVYTVPLLIGLVLSLFVFKKSPNRQVFNRIGLIVSSIYLFGTLGVKSYVENYFQNELAAQKIEYNSLLTMPVGIANLNWYGVAKTEEGIFMKKMNVLQNDPSEFKYFPTNDHLLNDVNPKLVDRMKWFAKDFYTVEKAGEQLNFYNLQVDMRGIIEDEKTYAPTAGYFIITSHTDGSYEFSSGAHSIK